MRYLLCAMLLAGLVACDDTAEGNRSAATPSVPGHEHSDGHAHDHEHDHDRLDHFEGLASEDWETAIAHLREYNRKLEAVLAQDEISMQDMMEIHRWSYTLENAVGRLQAELATVATHLEEVHLASERGEVERIREHGRQYLDGLAPLLAE